MSKISVLLSTYNGEKYLKEQLDSLKNQTNKDFEIIARDDGSIDGTVSILKQYDLELLESKHHLGPKDSYNELIIYALKNSNSEYFMFCDQDDVWKSSKIDKTLVKMKEMESKYGSIPILVHTDLEIVDENLNIISESMWKFSNINPKYNTFNRILMQNTITGCTIMLNRKLANKCIPIPRDAIMQDYWVALVASFFGKIRYLQESTILYRKHFNNTIGPKEFQFSVTKKVSFKDKVLIRNLGMNMNQARAFLEQFKSELDEKYIKLLIEFSTLLDKTWLKRRYFILKNKLFRQGCIRNLKLFLKI